LTANLLPECDGSATYGDLLLSLAANNHRTVAEITPVYLDVLRRLLRRGFLLAEEPTEATPLHGIHAANEMTNGSLQPVAALTN
jgi:hypothetical protein